jgi:hypothetical protein
VGGESALAETAATEAESASVIAETSGAAEVSAPEAIEALGRDGADVAEDSATEAGENVRYSQGSGNSAGGDSLIPGEETLQAALRDPALYGTELTATPKFNPALGSSILGRAIGNGALDGTTEIGPAAFSSRAELIQTIVHEEMHLRLDVRTMAGSQRAIQIQSSLSTEEDYVESVAQRFWQMYGRR